MTYAALEDMTTLWRPMTSAEQARASSLLEVVSASLNMEAQKVGKDLPARWRLTRILPWWPRASQWMWWPAPL